jgi:hypothetical protein
MIKQICENCASRWFYYKEVREKFKGPIIQNSPQVLILTDWGSECVRINWPNEDELWKKEYKFCSPWLPGTCSPSIAPPVAHILSVPFGLLYSNLLLDLRDWSCAVRCIWWGCRTSNWTQTSRDHLCNTSECSRQYRVHFITGSTVVEGKDAYDIHTNIPACNVLGPILLTVYIVIYLFTHHKIWIMLPTFRNG